MWYFSQNEDEMFKELIKYEAYPFDKLEDRVKKLRKLSKTLRRRK